MTNIPRTGTKIFYLLYFTIYSVLISSWFILNLSLQSFSDVTDVDFLILAAAAKNFTQSEKYFSTFTCNINPMHDSEGLAQELFCCFSFDQHGLSHHTSEEGGGSSSGG